MKEEKRKAPKLRFPGFDGDWEQRKFGDVGSVSMCKRIFKEETSPDGEIPFYKIGTFGAEPDAYISRELYEDYRAKFAFPEKGDILLSASGTIGRIVEYNGEDAYFQDSNIVWLSHDKTISNKFLKVLYPTVQWDGIEGSTIKRLYNDNFLRTQFSMPKIEEQEQLGSFFSDLDKIITLHQRKLDQIKEYKKGMLQKMFPKKGETVPEVRFPGFEGDWEKRKFEEVAKYRNGKAHENDIDTNGKYIVVNSKFVSTDGEVQKYSNFQNEPLYENEIAFVLSDVPNGRAIARTFLIDKSDKYTLNQRIAGITPLRRTYPYFLHILMNRNRYFLKFDDGVKQTNLSIADVMGFEEYYPCIEEQRKIGQYFECINNLITLHQHKLDQMKEYKKGLLQQMFV